jgi:hypothetical protein
MQHPIDSVECMTSIEHPKMWTDGFVEAITSRHYTEVQTWIDEINRLADQAQAYRPSKAQQRRSNSVADKAYVARKWDDLADHLLGWIQMGVPASSPQIAEAYRHIEKCLQPIRR